MNYVTLVVELPEGENPAIKPFMEVLGGKVTAVAWKDALAELERLEDCDVDCDDDCGGTEAGGIGSVSNTDFRYAKMQTVHQLLVNTVSRPTESTEKAIELAHMVSAAFAAIDAPEMGEVSDGYHTFNELYAHRVNLFAALMRAHVDKSWWSDTHHDGSVWDGWIIAGIDTPTGTATYHLPVSAVDQLWNITRQARGKEWDGHTSADVLYRLKSL